MKSTHGTIEFEAEVDDEGIFVIPSETFKRHNIKSGSKVLVRLTAGSLSKMLRERGITEDEVERLGMLQSEPRENVIRFLTAEGSLARNKKFQRRVKGLLG